MINNLSKTIDGFDMIYSIHTTFRMIIKIRKITLAN